MSLQEKEMQIDDALKVFQNQIKLESEQSGLLSEEDVDNWITMSRREDNYDCMMNTSNYKT